MVSVQQTDLSPENDHAPCNTSPMVVQSPYYIVCYTYTYINPHYQWFELGVYSVSIASTDWHTVSLVTYVCMYVLHQVHVCKVHIAFHYVFC